MPELILQSTPQREFHSVTAGDLHCGKDLRASVGETQSVFTIKLTNEWFCQPCLTKEEATVAFFQQKSVSKMMPNDESSGMFMHGDFAGDIALHCAQRYTKESNSSGFKRFRYTISQNAKNWFLLSIIHKNISALSSWYLCEGITWHFCKGINCELDKKIKFSELDKKLKLSLDCEEGSIILFSQLLKDRTLHELKSKKNKVVPAPIFFGGNVGISPFLNSLPYSFQKYLSFHGHIAIGQPGVKTSNTITLAADLNRGEFEIDESLIKSLKSKVRNKDGHLVQRVCDEGIAAVSKMRLAGFTHFLIIEDFHMKYDEVRRDLDSSHELTAKKIAEEVLSILKGRTAQHITRNSEVWVSTDYPIGILDTKRFRRGKGIQVGQLSGVSCINIIEAVRQLKLARLYMDEKLMRLGLGCCLKLLLSETQPNIIYDGKCELVDLIKESENNPCAPKKRADLLKSLRDMHIDESIDSESQLKVIKLNCPELYNKQELTLEQIKAGIKEIKDFLQESESKAKAEYESKFKGTAEAFVFTDEMAFTCLLTFNKLPWVNSITYKLSSEELKTRIIMVQITLDLDINKEPSAGNWYPRIGKKLLRFAVKEKVVNEGGITPNNRGSCVSSAVALLRNARNNKRYELKIRIELLSKRIAFIQGGISECGQDYLEDSQSYQGIVAEYQSQISDAKNEIEALEKEKKCKLILNKVFAHVVGFTHKAQLWDPISNAEEKNTAKTETEKYVFTEIEEIERAKKIKQKMNITDFVMI